MRKLYVYLVVGLIAGIAGLSGCNIINPEEPIPTYVHIEKFDFDDTNPRGSSSRNITHVWAYVDNQPVGIFDLPVTFPVAITKNSVLTVLPGVDFQGLRGYPVTYPLYAGVDTTLAPRPGETVNWSPATYYLSGSQLLFNETFDQAVRLKFAKRSGDTTLERTTNDVFEGGGSGLFVLGPGHDSVTVLSDSMQLTAGRAAYIEVDMKGDMQLYVGMRSYRNDGIVFDEYLIRLESEQAWKKFYVGIREFVGANQGTKFQVLLGTRKKEGQSTGTLRIDNVKVVSF